MRVGISSDHRGYELKQKIIAFIIAIGHDIIDFGTKEIDEKVDYPDYAKKVCDALKNKQIELGILICGTGIGMSIAANKIKTIRCGKVNSVEECRLAKQHNDINVIAIPEYLDNYEKIVETFLKTGFGGEERHKNRINKIKELENRF